MVIEKHLNAEFPKDAYVDVLKPIDADISIVYPYKDDIFYFHKCICILWVRGENNERRYFLAEHFESFDNNTLNKINEGHYKTEGVLVFFKDLKFLEDFKKTNTNYIKS